MKISGSIALVTGASRGIGKCLVVELLRQGAAKVYATARDISMLAETVSLDTERVIPLELDVTKGEQIAAAVLIANDVTILFNNAGVFNAGDLLVEEDEIIRRDFETNFYGLIATTRGFLPVLRKSQSAAVVNVLSVVSLASMPSLSGYSASKAAAHSFTQGIRPGLSEFNISVHGVYPGPVDTDMTEGLELEKASPESVAQRIVAGVEADEEEIYPDDMASHVRDTYATSPKSLEQEFSGF